MMTIKKLILIMLLIVTIAYFGPYLYRHHLTTQARFNVEALGRYVRSYHLVTGEPLPRLSGLPNIRLVSPSNSLSFKSEDVKSGISRGYSYDLKPIDEKRFVISASPLSGSFAEFGMTEDMNLRVNIHQMDPEPDSYDEVKKWPIIPSLYSIITDIESS
ncbi:MAG: hypothetical protein AB1650_04270 [Candidatus Omnitrophota bacterium]